MSVSDEELLRLHADDMGAVNARTAGSVLDAGAPGIGDYLRGQCDILGIYAASFRKLLGG